MSVCQSDRLISISGNTTFTKKVEREFSRFNESELFLGILGCESKG